MAAHEVEKMLFDSRKPEEAPQVKMEFVKGDKVTIKEGPFQNYPGEVDEVLADWWQEFSMADDNLRQDLIDQVREEQQKRKHAPNNAQHGTNSARKFRPT
jgi:ribosomal protein L24